MSGTLFAQGLGSHVHGEAELNIVAIGNAVQFEFISPAMNLLGFERAPANAEETARLDSANADLRDSAVWLLGNTLSSCQLTNVSFAAPEFDGSDASDASDESHSHAAHDHEEAHEADHGNEQADYRAGGHTDYQVQYLYECPEGSPRSYPVRAFARFGGIEEITVQWVIENRQGFAQLTASNSTLFLD